jgi:hypothetical protein
MATLEKEIFAQQMYSLGRVFIESKEFDQENGATTYI